MLGAARLHKRIDQPEQALLDYRHAAQIAPTLRTKARAFLAIGVIHGRALKTIKTDERRKFTRELALKEIDLALIADPSFDRAYFVRGTILESAGDYVGAINALNGALERVDPQSENATKYREIRQRVLTKLSKTKAR